MKEYTVMYTTTKVSRIDDPFAVVKFVARHEGELCDILTNIEKHFDGIIIDCGDDTEIPNKQGRKRRKK